MTLLLMEGFDSFDIQDSKGRVGTAHANVVNGVGRDGVGQCIEMSAHYSIRTVELPFPPIDDEEFVIGFSLKFSKAPTSTSDLFRLLTTDNAATSYAMGLRVEPSGVITVRRSTTILATSEASIAFGEWLTLEMKLHINNSGSFTIRLNGADVPGLTAISADTLASTTRQEVGTLKLYGNLTSGGPLISFDNLYLLDTNGTVNNDFLGEVRIATRYPDADAGPNEFTAVGAGTDQYERVDESTSDDDTTYLHSDVVGEEESFTFPDLPAEVDSVLAVLACSTLRKDGAGTRTVKNKVTGSSATVEDGLTVGLGDGYAMNCDLLELDPGTSAAWTKANANAIELGVEIVS